MVGTRIGPGGLTLLGLLWVVAIGAGLWRLAVYEWTPGAEALPPARWPADAGPAPDRSTLVLFAHARCPCTRASLDTLDELARAAGERLAVRVVLWDPVAPGAGAPGGLAAQAAAIPGARLVADDGATGALFRVRTSGHALLYDGAGQLVYSGGLTAGRGRLGPSAGRSAIEAFLAGLPAAAACAPVYGCSLLTCEPGGAP